jgi:hypothetical protein
VTGLIIGAECSVFGAAAVLGSPCAVVEVWEQVAVGFTDEDRGLNVDGHAWRQVAWDGARFA